MSSLGEWAFMRQLGNGTFGTVHKAKRRNGDLAAVKIARGERQMAVLEREHDVYKALEENSITNGFPRLIYYKEHRLYRAIVMTLLGSSLRDVIRRKKNGTFPLAVVLKIGMHLLTRVQALHGINYVHRDIKPENIMFGSGMNSNTVYLVDFGLAARHEILSEEAQNNEQQQGSFAGTVAYCSVNTHYGGPLCFADDLESILYVLLELKLGSLPWNRYCGKKKRSSDKRVMRREVRRAKEDFTPAFVRSVLGIAGENLYMHIKGLNANDRPDYGRMIWNFRKEMLKRPWESCCLLSLRALEE